jgi:hypothetical protein
MDSLIFNALQNVAAEEDQARRDELRRETGLALGEHFARHEDEMEELAFDLVNLAWSDSKNTDLVGRVIEVKTVGLAEVDYIESDLRGMRAYWQGKGGQIRSDILRYERAQMPREEIVSAIDLHLDEIRTNFWASFDKLSSKAQEEVRNAPVERLVELIRAAIGAGDATFGQFAAATISSAQVDPIIDQVAMRSGGMATILGTQVATRKLAGIGLDYGDNIKEQIFRTGVIGVYKGYPVANVENFEDFAGNFVLPNDELWIVGKTTGRLTYYGEQAKVQQLQLPSFMRRWETARDAGMLLYGAEKGRLGRIVLT